MWLVKSKGEIGKKELLDGFWGYILIDAASKVTVARGLPGAVVAVVGDLVTGFSDHRFPFQRKNSHSLIRKIEVFQLLLESLRDSRVRALLEGALFAGISFQQILLDYCAQLSKAVDLSNNVREQIELLRRQSRRARLFVDKKDDVVRIKFFSFLEAFENERIPCSDELS
ncbi:U-box domain-containing protein [Arachis hypogaea]|nr:U-box domain-containing protein [Arachis hypogaea]